MGWARWVRRVTAHLPRFGARWLKALPAAVFEAFEVRPSRSTFDAALAALALVFRPGMDGVLPVVVVVAGSGPLRT